MTIREVKRLLTERGCAVGWVDDRKGMEKDLRYSVGVKYQDYYAIAIEATVQAAYDRILEHMETIDRKEGTG